jgi:hypothetical protein
LPVHSSVKSTPSPPVSSRRASTGSVTVASMVSVAPNSVASDSRDGTRSMATIRVQPRSRAASSADRPTAPVPKIAMLEPAGGASALNTAPAPVDSPQARGPSSSMGASGATLTTLRSHVITRVANDDWPKKWLCTGSPPGRRSALDPSGRPPEVTIGGICTQ